MGKQKVFPEESDPNGYCSQYLHVHASPNKKLGFQDGERENSINSNLSHSFGYNHEDFPSFGNKNMMNLSKPIDVNFDNFNMVPNISNYSYNMMNKMTDSLKMSNKNLSLNLNFSNAEYNLQPEGEQTSVYDLNNLSASLDFNMNKNTRIVLEMTGPNQLKVITCQKEPSNSSSN